MSDAENLARHRAGLPHAPHPAPLEDDPPRREPTEAEKLWELHDRGFISDEEYAKASSKLPAPTPTPTPE